MKKLALLTALMVSFSGLTHAQVQRVANNNRPAGNLTQEVIGELNRVRTNPQAYAIYLSEHRSLYTAEGYLKQPGKPLLRTHEGVAALDEAIRELSHARPQPPLSASDLLVGSARLLVDDQSQSGQTGHGSYPFDRMARAGVVNGARGEDVAYGAHTAEQIVYNLVVDDGVRDRGHRRNIMQTMFNQAGVSVGSHPVYGTMCVIDFAGGF